MHDQAEVSIDGKFLSGIDWPFMLIPNAAPLVRWGSVAEQPRERQGTASGVLAFNKPPLAPKCSGIVL